MAQITWRNIQGNGGFRDAAYLLQGAQESFDSGFGRFQGILDQRRQTQDANRENTISNNEADFRKYLSGLRAQGPGALEEAQASGALDARLAGYRGMVSRDLDPTALARENILGARSDATQNREYEQGEALAAAQPVLQDWQARRLQDPNAVMTPEEEATLRQAMLLDDAAVFNDNRGQTELDRRNAATQFAWDVYNQGRKVLGDTREDAYEASLNNIQPDLPYYESRSLFTNSLENLTGSNRLKALEQFDAAFAHANKLSDDDVARLRFREEEIDKATTAQVAEQEAIAATNLQRYEEEIPLGARQDAPFHTTADLTKWILEKGNVDKDYLIGNDLQTGVENLVTNLDKHLEANPKLAKAIKDMGYNTLGIAADIAMRNVSDKDEDGNLIFELANRGWKGMEDPKYITDILAEYAANDYVSRGIGYKNLANTAAKAARDLPTSAVGDKRKAFEELRKGAQYRQGLTGNSAR